MSPFDRPSFARLDRRTLLKRAVGAGLVVAGWPLARPAVAQVQFKAFPFSLGVAAGEPATDGFVIWTRLAPEPLEPRGGMSARAAEVNWEVAADENMQRIVRSGKTIARVEIAHSVHVEVAGLDPGREYFYRFNAGGVQSAVGRARTLPPANADVAQLKFASAGCQLWEGGYYTAWRRIAEEAFDLVVHYGDYIYERARFTEYKDQTKPARVLPKGFPACINLIDYRRRYALYKSDGDLQAAHASCAFLSSFDDHEVVDNWSADTEAKGTPPEAFLFRRAAAFQAWYEHMPVRSTMLPRGPDIAAYRRFQFGRLADISVLDTRQYRSPHPCGDGWLPVCPQADEPQRTMLGERQERWLDDQLRSASGTWQILAQQVLFSRFDSRSFPTVNADVEIRRMDGWDGATAGQQRLLKSLRESKTVNPVILSGDAHMAMAFEVREDWHDSKASPIAVEFLATSISSGGDGAPTVKNADLILSQNPHLKFLGNERGYTRHVVTAKLWTADHRGIERVSTAGAAAATRKSLVVEAGQPGLKEA